MSVDTDNGPKEITIVEILMDDTAIPVGTTFMASAIVEPADTDKALVWSSSNQDVMTVGQDGLVTIKGTGTAALTATVGDVSDAVAIEGISSVTAGSKNGYIIYTGNGSLTKSSQSTSGSGSSSSTSGRYSTASGSNSGTDNYQDNGSENNNTYPGGNSGNSGSLGYGGNDNGSNPYAGDDSDSGSTGNDSGNNSSDSGSTSGGGSSDGKTSSDIGDVLGGQGFTQEYSNVYVYTENGTYYGEIITQPNVSIIYIKQRNGGFDTRIKGVLEELLPDSYDQVWNNYVSATSDRTFTVEGRKVRIVTASRGGHSQIVIYN